MVIIDKYFDKSRDIHPDDVDKRLAIAISWRDYDEQVRQEMLHILAEAAVESFPAEVEARVRSAAYHVGPMASGPFVQMLFTAYEDIRPVVSDTASWVAVGGFALLVVRRTHEMLRRLMSEQGAEVDPDMYPGVLLQDEIVISQPLIQGLCFQHFWVTYGHPKQRVSMDANCRSPHPEIVWAGRPEGMLSYTVRIWTGQTSYVYVIDGYGNPIEHFSTRGRKFTSLTLPDWFEEVE